MLQSETLRKKVAVVTGGSRGIGRAIVEGLVEAGYFVEFTYQSNRAAAGELLEKVGPSGANGTQLCAQDPVGNRAFVASLKQRHGGIDVLVCNAGIMKDSHFAMMREEDWSDVHNVNFTSLFPLVQSVTKIMIHQRRGNIVFMSSVAGLRGQPGQTNYSASKAAILAFAQTLARELGRYQIRVNSIAPGFIDTDMTRKIDRVFANKLKEQIPLQRPGKAEEISNVVRFLVSEDASYIHGANLVVDGGLT